MSRSKPGLLIRGARQLVTMRGIHTPRRGAALLDIGVIHDGAIFIRGSSIYAIGPSRQIQSLAAARNCEEIDASGRVILPGFVDVETALVLGHPSPRTLDQTFRTAEGVENSDREGAHEDTSRGLLTLSARALKRRADTIGQGMLRYGTTTVEAHPGSVTGERETLRILRVHKDSAKPLDLFSAYLAQRAEGETLVKWSANLCDRILPLLTQRRLARQLTFQHTRQTLPEQIGRRIAERAWRLGMSIRATTHDSNTTSAVPLAIRTGSRSVSCLQRVTAREIRALASTSMVATLKPGVSLHGKLSQLEPGRALIDAGVAPGLASGYHPEHSPSYNMQLMMILACHLYGWRVEEALAAATINNAYALRADSTLGSLETGKQADLLILNVPDFREAAYYGGINVVDTVIKRGKIVHTAAPDLVSEEDTSDFD